MALVARARARSGSQRRVSVPKFELSSASPAEITADLLILPFYQGRDPGPGLSEIGKALGVDLPKTLQEHHVTGRPGDSLIFPTLGKIAARTLMVVGVGPKDEAGPGAVRRAAQRVARRVAGFATVATALHQAAGDGGPETMHAFAEGLLLGTYRFDRYKRQPI